MVTLRIDGREVAVGEGATVLEAAQKAGVSVPTMCYLPGYRNHTSCMVCLVKERQSGRFLPACSSPAQDGMDVDTCSDEVATLRKGALDLLLSEHVGDCEAPCRRVCPAGMNIPLLLRLAAAGDWPAAGELVAEAQPPCVLDQDCPAPCERVCRRGQVDAAVSIRLVTRYARTHRPDDAEGAGTGRPAAPPLRNVSVLPKLREDEKAEMLKGADPGPRVEPSAGAEAGFSAEEAVREAGRCMHCDCRKAETCLLRRYAAEYGGEQKRYRGRERTSFERIVQHPDVIYEPGKCIKCGICVRITEKAREPLGLTFIGRGFDMRVGVPFDEVVSEGLKRVARDCIAACPTGALAATRPLADEAGG